MQGNVRHLRAIAYILKSSRDDGGFSFNSHGLTLMVTNAMESYNEKKSCNIVIGADDELISKHDKEELFCEIINVAIKKMEMEERISKNKKSKSGRSENIAANVMATKCLDQYNTYNPGKATSYPNGGYMLFLKSVHKLVSSDSKSSLVWAGRKALKDPPWQWYEEMAAKMAISSTSTSSE